MGRDFARVILALRDFDEIRPFWSWFTTPVNPDAPLSAPISAIVAIPSQKKYIACRLTPLMESEILYMMENVKNGKQGSYEVWYQETHFPYGPSDDPSALICDLIRYIVTVYHPSNAILASNVVQRWSVITRLYTLIINEKAALEAHLSIFMDWLFFDPSVDSIMSIEPGCLVLTKGLAKLPAIVIGAISYLAYYRHQFGQHPKEAVMGCLDLAMKVCVEKGVIPSIEGMLNSPVLDPVSTKTLLTLFPTGSKMALAAPHSTGEPFDHRSRAPSLRSESSTSSSKLVSPRPSHGHETLDSDEEIEAEHEVIKQEMYDLLMDKIKLLSPNSAYDSVLLSLANELKVLEKKLVKPGFLPTMSSPSFLRGLDARVHPLLGIDYVNEAPEIQLPKTMTEFSKFKSYLLARMEEYNFPPAEQLKPLVEASLSLSATEQIWFWKSLVLLLQSIPVERLFRCNAPETLKSLFSLISDKNEILVTGLQDALTTLHARSPIIPHIFDGIREESEAFQTFVEQAIMLSRP